MYLTSLSSGTVSPPNGFELSYALNSESNLSGLSKSLLVSASAHVGHLCFFRHFLTTYPLTYVIAFLANMLPSTDSDLKSAHSLLSVTVNGAGVEVSWQG